MKLQKAKELAIQMRRKRIELRELLAEKISFETNTAESLSENTKFDFIVSQCTYHTNGSKVYDSLEDYETKSDDPVAFQAAQALAEMMFSMDKDFESNLPENKFLKQYKFVDEELRLVNKDGKRVDTEGRLINEEGRYIDEEGGYVDVDGNPIDEDGDYLVEDVLPFLDDEGNPLAAEETSEDEEGDEETKPKASKPKKKATRKKKAETTAKATVEATAESE